MAASPLPSSSSSPSKTTPHSSSSSSSRASLLALPIELKFEIFRSLPDLPTLRCLKLASRDFCDLARYCHDRGVFGALYEHEAEQRKIDSAVRFAHQIKGKIVQRWRPEIETVICDATHQYVALHDKHPHPASSQLYAPASNPHLFTTIYDYISARLSHTLGLLIPASAIQSYIALRTPAPIPRLLSRTLVAGDQRLLRSLSALQVSSACSKSRTSKAPNTPQPSGTSKPSASSRPSTCTRTTTTTTTTTHKHSGNSHGSLTIATELITTAHADLERRRLHWCIEGWAAESVWNHLPALIAPDLLQRACVRQPEIARAVGVKMGWVMPGVGMGEGKDEEAGSGSVEPTSSQPAPSQQHTNENETASTPLLFELVQGQVRCVEPVLLTEDEVDSMKISEEEVRLEIKAKAKAEAKEEAKVQTKADAQAKSKADAEAEVKVGVGVGVGVAWKWEWEWE